MSQNEIRKLPKKTIFIITIIIAITLLGFLLITFSKQAKMEEVLNSLGHKNIESVMVYNVSPVEDQDTKKKGTLYKISFFDKESNKKCIGFIYKHNSTYKEDIECK